MIVRNVILPMFVPNVTKISYQFIKVKNVNHNVVTNVPTVMLHGNVSLVKSVIKL